MAVTAEFRFPKFFLFPKDLSSFSSKYTKEKKNTQQNISIAFIQ